MPARSFTSAGSFEWTPRHLRFPCKGLCTLAEVLFTMYFLKLVLNLEILQVTATWFKMFKPFGGPLNIVQISLNSVCDFVVPKGNFVKGGPKQLPQKNFWDTLCPVYNVAMRVYMYDLYVLINNRNFILIMPILQSSAVIVYAWSHNVYAFIYCEDLYNALDQSSAKEDSLKIASGDPIADAHVEAAAHSIQTAWTYTWRTL